MKSILILFCLTTVVIAAKISYKSDDKWHQYKKEHTKQYKSSEEEATRYEKWLKTVKQVKEHNEKYEKGLSTYTLAVNQFADWTIEELKSLSMPASTFQSSNKPSTSGVVYYTGISTSTREFNIDFTTDALRRNRTSVYSYSDGSRLVLSQLLNYVKASNSYVTVTVWSSPNLQKQADGTFIRRTTQPNGVVSTTIFDPNQIGNGFYESTISFPKAAPSSLDWRNNPSGCPQSNGNCVSPVKDQDQCGSCWAFSAVAALESQLLIRNRYPGQLSEQAMADCATLGRADLSNGCEGGYEGRTLTDLSNMGAALQSNYPYVSGSTGKSYACKLSSTPLISSYKSIFVDTYKDEKTLVQAIANLGPATFGMLICNDIYSYSSGIYQYSENCAQPLGGHAMTIVGYGRDSATGLDFWLIKNSWGSWGLNKSGYGMIPRGVDSGKLATRGGGFSIPYILF